MVTLLDGYWQIADSVKYQPKAGTGHRSILVTRSEWAVEGNDIRPLLLRDPEFWDDAVYCDIIETFSRSGARHWDTAQPAKLGQRTGGQVLRPVKLFGIMATANSEFAHCEMIGVMMAVLKFDGHSDLLVSAAPNMLHNKTGFFAHPDPSVKKGQGNDGTQIHSEMFFASQLEAVYGALVKRTPLAGEDSPWPLVDGNNPALPAAAIAVVPAAVPALKPSKAWAKAPPKKTALEKVQARFGAAEVNTDTDQYAATASVGKFYFDVDMYIQKDSLCAGCEGVWKSAFSRATDLRPKGPGVFHRYRAF